MPPLSQGDPSLFYDGSWRDASEDWPAIHFKTYRIAQMAYVIAWRDVHIPYGSYVLVDTTLRIETNNLFRKLIVELVSQKWKIETKTIHYAHPS